MTTADDVIAEVRRAKHHLAGAVDEALPSLIGLSEAIHAHPETAWQEHRAAAWVADALADAGFETAIGAYDVDTAVFARFGSGSHRIGLVAEYDALPGLGHACGHNIIAATAVGAAKALATVADDFDLTVELYGAPAEEGGGGKIAMLERGAFAGLDVALMAHPGPVDVARARPFAVTHSHIRFDGVSSHAGAYPDRGVNANDAFVIAQVAIGLLRQQLPADSRVHGIQTVGGSAPNAIPATTEGRWYVRADTLAELEALERRVLACFEAGALASGTSLTVTPESQPYDAFRTNERALGLWEANAVALGRPSSSDERAGRMARASTDMGNVSQVVPSIHPYLGIDSRGAANHEPEFASACVGPSADKAVLDGAIGLAWTALDFTAGRWSDC